MGDYRIKFVESPPEAKIGRPASRKETLNETLTRLDNNHRGKWARIGTTHKNVGFIYTVRKNNFPNMEIVTRTVQSGKNKGSHEMYVRFHDKPIKKARRASTIASGEA